MAATINGKTEVLRETFLFKEDQVVEMTSPARIRIVADASKPVSTAVVLVNGVFEIQLNGYVPPQNGQCLRQPVALGGIPHEFLINADRVVQIDGMNVYVATVVLYPL